MEPVMDKKTFLTLLQTERAHWEALLAEVGEACMLLANAEGHWSVKDIIAHVAAYEDWMASTIQRARDGQAYVSEERGGLEDLEQRNRRIFEANRDRQLDDIRQDDQLAYQRLLTVVQTLSDEDLTHRDSFEGILPSFMKEQPLWEYIAGNSYEHYRDHISSIRTWLSTLQA